MTEQINLVRAFAIEDVLIRERTSAKERIVEAVVVPFNTPARVADFGGSPYMEAFPPTAFDKQFSRDGAAGRVDLRWAHKQGMLDWLGSGIAFTKYRDHLRGKFKVFSGPVGDHALGVLEDVPNLGISIGFRAREDDFDLVDGVVYRREAHIREASLTTQNAYDDARVLQVRSRPDGDWYLAERDAPAPTAAPPAKPVRLTSDPRTLRALERLGIQP